LFPKREAPIWKKELERCRKYFTYCSTDWENALEIFRTIFSCCRFRKRTGKVLKLFWPIVDLEILILLLQYFWTISPAKYFLFSLAKKKLLHDSALESDTLEGHPLCDRRRVCTLHFSCKRKEISKFSRSRIFRTIRMGVCLPAVKRRHISSLVARSLPGINHCNLIGIHRVMGGIWSIDWSTATSIRPSFWWIVSISTKLWSTCILIG